MQGLGKRHTRRLASDVERQEPLYLQYFNGACVIMGFLCHRLLKHLAFLWCSIHFLCQRASCMAEH
jgi:hypothetical protein